MRSVYSRYNNVVKCHKFMFPASNSTRLSKETLGHLNIRTYPLSLSLLHTYVQIIMLNKTHFIPLSLVGYMYCIDTHSMLATKLNMTPEEAEKWIVNLIRNVRLDARIDAKQVPPLWI